MREGAIKVEGDENLPKGEESRSWALVNETGGIWDAWFLFTLAFGLRVMQGIHAYQKKWHTGQWHAEMAFVSFGFIGIGIGIIICSHTVQSSAALYIGQWVTGMSSIRFSPIHWENRNDRIDPEIRLAIPLAYAPLLNLLGDLV